MNYQAVIDCSIAAAWFISDEDCPTSERLLSEILDSQIKMIVPDLWWYEIMNVIKSGVLRRKIKSVEANQIFLFLNEIPKKVFPAEEQGQFSILKMAIDENLSVYDASYLHLAFVTGSLLYTNDQDLLSLQSKYPFIQSVSL